jgi:hypothetical protein
MTGLDFLVALNGRKLGWIYQSHPKTVVYVCTFSSYINSTTDSELVLNRPIEIWMITLW